MPFQLFSRGAVQAAYPSYVFIDISPSEPIATGHGSTILVWPTTYINVPYVDPVTNKFHQVAAANIEVYTDNLNVNTITMPDATKTSIGQTITMINSGLSSFNVLADDGETIIANVPISDDDHANTVWFLLADNSTTNGVWIPVTFGAGTSQVTAGTLAGNGLTAISGKLDTEIPIILHDTIPTIDSSYRAKEVIWLGNFAASITLPLINSVPAGFYLSFNNQSPTNSLIIDPGEAGTTIDGLTTFTLDQSRSLTIISDGHDWWTLGYGASPNPIITVNALDVSGSSNINLNFLQATSNIQIYNGTLTGNITVFFPINKAGFWFIQNNTTGPYQLSVQIFGPVGPSYIVPQGNNQVFYTDGGDNGLILSPSALFPKIISLINGNSANPALSFVSNPGSGMFYSPSGQFIGFSNNGILQAVIGSTGASNGGIFAIGPDGSTLSIMSSSLLHEASFSVSPPPLGSPNVEFMSVNQNTQIVNLSQPLPIDSGGTESDNRIGAINNILPPSPLKGTIIWWDGTNWSNLPRSTTVGQSLQVIDGTGTLGWVT